MSLNRDLTLRGLIWRSLVTVMLLPLLKESFVTRNLLERCAYLLELSAVEKDPMEECEGECIWERFLLLMSALGLFI